jgi:hypothetical protein
VVTPPCGGIVPARMDEEAPAPRPPASPRTVSPTAHKGVVRPSRGRGKHAQRIRASSVKSASNMVLLVAILQLLFGAYFGFTTKGEVDEALAQIETMVQDGDATAEEAAQVRIELQRQATRSFAIPIGLGVAFLGLWLWARKSALPALCTALGLFVIVHVGGAFMEPGTVLRGILLKVFVIAALASGIKSALQQRAIAQREAAEPAA